MNIYKRHFKERKKITWTHSAQDEMLAWSIDGIILYFRQGNKTPFRKVKKQYLFPSISANTQKIIPVKNFKNN